MKLVFIGPQGSGKGTQAKIIAKKLGVPHISMGELLRSVEGDLKEKIRECQDKGLLVPNEITIKVLKERLEKDDCRNGFILDGFPRNVEQLELLERITKIDKIIEIVISEEESLKRLSGRWNCKNCSALYNTVTGPKPKEKGKCDSCSGVLYQREDDKEQAIKERLKIYWDEREKMKAVGNEVDIIEVDGEQDIDKVTKDIEKALGI